MIKTIGEAAIAWFSCLNSVSETTQTKKDVLLSLWQMNHQSTLVWQGGFQVKSTAKSERARQTGKQWKKGDRERDESNEETITERDRGKMWLSEGALLAESCQCVTVVVKVKVPRGRDSDNGLHQSPSASHCSLDKHTRTRIFRGMLFVLISSACLSASKPEWRWQERGWERESGRELAVGKEPKLGTAKILEQKSYDKSRRG